MPASSPDVAEFFDRQAAAYHASEGPMAPFHRLTAARIEAGIHGRVLAIGGLWDQAQLHEDLEVTVVDVSPEMLGPWREHGAEAVVGDARALPFPDDSFDHVVYGLVLHHITEGGFRSARLQLDRIFDELARVLVPGGEVWISDFSVGRVVYAAQGLASPLTKRLLATSGIPLVIMHRAATYQRRLRTRGFRGLSVFRPRPEGVSGRDFLTPVIGLPWLRLPRALYPLEPVLLHAASPLQGLPRDDPSGG